MLRLAKDLQDLAIAASDGAIGDVKDLYFDDEAWAIRSLVVETSSWLSSRKVLLSPIAADKPDWTTKPLPVSLSREQVKNRPDIDTDMPVTRRHETDYLDCYNYPYYWGGTGLLWGSSGTSDGHDVLVAPQWIRRVSWAQQTVAVDLTREALKQAPCYDPALPLSREMEIAVYKDYGRAAY